MTHLRSLFIVLLIHLATAGATLGHEIVIEVRGKQSATVELPSVLGEQFFTAFRGTSARVEDEIQYQLSSLTINGSRLRESTTSVDPDISIALEANSNSAFEALITGFGFNTRGSVTCPDITNGLGCKYVNFVVDVNHLKGIGRFDFASGASSLRVGPGRTHVDIDTKLRTFSSIFLGWLYRAVENILLEPLAEETIESALQAVDYEGQLLGLADILNRIHTQITPVVGVDVRDLLNFPLHGLEVDLGLNAPIGYQTPGRIIVRIQHRAPSNLRASLSSDRRPTVTWNGVPNAASYRVYRKSGTTDFRHIATTTNTSWTGRPILPSGNDIVSFRVVAINRLGITSRGSYPVAIVLKDPGCSGTSFRDPCLSDNEPR